MTADVAQPPRHVEAEQGLLGALLFDNGLVERLPPLVASDFFFPEHQKIYAAVREMVAAGITADAVTLKARFAQDEALKEIGGGVYLMKLLDLAAPLSSQAISYAALIRDLAMRRALHAAAQRIMALATKPPEKHDAGDLIMDAQHAIDALGSAASDVKLITLAEAADSYISDLDNVQTQAISTGLELLDRRLGGGLFRGDLVVVAGRPSMGKTTLAMNIARSGAKARADAETGELKPGAKVGVFSAEMSAQSLAMRALSASGYMASDYGSERFSYAHLRNGAPNIERRLIHRAAEGLRDYNMLIDDRAGLTVRQIEWSARAMRRQLGGLDVIVIDYLQILGRPSGDNAARVLGEMTQALKTMARNMKIVVVLLSQLSRAAESRDDKRPQLNDLRESGAIEQDADVVIGVYREAYYLERREPREEDGADKLAEWTERMERARDLIEAITLKQRNGPPGTDELRALVKHDLIMNK